MCSLSHARCRYKNRRLVQPPVVSKFYLWGWNDNADRIHTFLDFLFGCNFFQRHPLRTVIGPEGMMVGDPCPMHKHLHTILGLMDAQDPLFICVHHGRSHLPWLLHEHAEPFNLISLHRRGGSPDGRAPLCNHTYYYYMQCARYCTTITSGLLSPRGKQRIKRVSWKGLGSCVPACRAIATTRELGHMHQDLYHISVI